jgi:myosin heavy chain 6/7
LEQEKTNRDHTIRSLNDEIANQDEIINKINKEKKHIGDNQAKALKILQNAEDKVDHLTKSETPSLSKLKMSWKTH